MPFITQGPEGEQAPYGVNKTNWKLLVIVIILAILVGGGVLGWQWLEFKKEMKIPEFKLSEKIKDETVNWKTYRNEEYGFEFKYPSNWEIAEGEKAVTLFQEKKGLEKTIVGTMNVIKTTEEDLGEALSKYRESLKKNEELIDLTERQILVDGITTTEIYFKRQMEGNKWIFNSLVFISSGKDIMIDFMRDTISREEYPSAFAQILSTFKFIENETAKEQACINFGGTVTTVSCCKSVGDFPNSCLTGACGCSPDDSHQVKTCDCGEGKCFDGEKCVGIQEGEEENNVISLAFSCNTKDERTGWYICKTEDNQFEFQKPNDFSWIKNIDVITNCKYETFQEECPKFNDLILAFEKEHGCNESCLKAWSSNLSSWGAWSRVIVGETPFCVYKTCDCGAGSCGCEFFHTAIRGGDCYMIHSLYSRVNCSTAYGIGTEDFTKCEESQNKDDKTFQDIISTFKFTEEKISIRIYSGKVTFNIQDKSFEAEDLTGRRFLVITDNSTKFYRKADDKIIGWYNGFSDFANIMQNCYGVSCPLEPTVEGILQSDTTIKATDIYSFVQ